MQLVSSLSLLLFLLNHVCVCFPGANLTSNLDRIKIVFTPMLCRRLCSGGHCYNSCEKGDITTVYSETSQQQQPNNQGFRLCECWLQALSLSLTLIFLVWSSLLLIVSSCLFSLLTVSRPYVLVLTQFLCISILVSHLFLWGELNKMGSQWHAVWIPSSERRQSGGD